MENKDNTNSNMQKVALTALAGTSIEWYDFFPLWSSCSINISNSLLW
jgi:hypothetical protein